MQWLENPEVVRSSFLQCGIAIVAVGFAVVIKLLFDSLMQDSPFLLFFGAVIISTAYGGLRSGIVAILLSAIFIDALFLVPSQSILTQEPSQNLRWAIFIAESGFLSVVIARLKKANRLVQLREAALQVAYSEMEQRVEERTAQLYEANQELHQQMTERQRTEMALQDQERRFQAIFDQTFQFIGLMRPDGVLLEANQTALDFGGLQRADVIDRPFWEARWWTISSQTQAELRQAIELAATGEFIRYEVDVLGRGGAIATIDFSIKPVQDESGQVVLLIPEGRDITELKQAEYTLRSFFDSASMMMGIVELVDADIRHIADNMASAQFFGQITERMRNCLASEMGAPRSHIETWMGHYRKAEQTQTPVRFEYSHQTPQGERWLSATVCAIPVTTGQLSRFSYIVEDVTERRQIEAQLRQLNLELEQRVYERTAQLEATNQQLANEIQERERTLVELRQVEESLRHSEQQFRLVAESMPQIVWTARSDGSVDYYNQRWAEYSGISCEGGHNFGWKPVLHPEDEQRTVDAWFQAVESGQLYECEHRIKRADGQFRWFLSRGLPLRNEQGQIMKWFGTATDIHTQKETQEELRESQERFRQLAETVEDVFWLMDWQTYQVLYVSPAYERIWGRSCQQLYDDREDWLEAIHPDDRSVVKSSFYEQASQGGYDTTYRIVRSDGNVRWIRDRGFPIYNSAGQTYRMAGLAEDITKQKQIELTLHHQSQELALANRLKDEFLATVSHELRTPLNAMLGWSNLLPSRKLNAETTTRALDAIARNTRAMAQLVEDVLDMSDIITGQVRLEAIPVSLDLTIAQALAAVHLAAEVKKIQVDSQVDSSVGLVLGDPARLQQIVWNLLVNAIKFTPVGGDVSISLNAITRSLPADESLQQTMQQQYAQIAVKDTGKGISSEFLPFVFDRFRQEDGSTTRLYGGLGLGLAIVRYLVEQHGGKVWAESPGEGQGAVFTVELPVLT